MLLLFAILGLRPADRAAAAPTFTPEVSLSMGYNDNVRLGTNNRRDDVTAGASARAALADRTEIFNWRLNGSVDGLRYLGNEEPEERDWSLGLEGGYRFSSLVSGFLQGAHAENTRADLLLEETGLLIPQFDQVKDSFSLGASLVVTETTKVILSGLVMDERYGGSGYDDVSGVGASLLVEKNLREYLPRLDGRAALRWNRYAWTRRTSDIYSLSAGFTYALSERWALSAEAGVSDNLSRDDALYFFFGSIPELESENWGGVGSLLLSYTTPDDTARLGFERSETPAAGSASLTTRDRLELSLRHRIIQDLDGVLTADWTTNESSGRSSRGIDQETVTIYTALRYALTKPLALEGGYQWMDVHNRHNEADATRNVYTLKLIYRHEPFAFFD